MTSTDVTTIIDTLCEKLGLAADSFSELVPELAALEIRMATFAITVCAAILIILIIASVIVFPRTWHSIKYNDKCYDEDLSDHGFAIGLICADICGAVITLVVIICNVANIICWTSAPEIQAIIYILDLLGGGS